MADLFRRDLLFQGEAASHEDVAETFHVNTRLQPDAVGVGGQFPTSTSPAEEAAMNAVGRTNRVAETIPLPAPLPVDEALSDVLLRRRTVRSFSPDPLPLAVLSTLLFHTNGVTHRTTDQRGRPRAFRAAPSAGALYPGELYLALHRVEGVEPCLAHYRPSDHRLEILRHGDPAPALRDAVLYPEELAACAVTVVFSAVHRRTRLKYGPRGYRYALLDVGHLTQNLCLSAAAQGVACMTCCGFYDEPMDAILGLDGLDESSLYLAFVGLEAP